MNTYLAIITTALVLTQIIRLTQNAIQLRLYTRKVDEHNELILRVYRKIEAWLDKQEAGQ